MFDRINPPSPRRVGFVLLVASLGLSWPTEAEAHKFRPALLEIQPSASGYAITWKYSARQRANGTEPGASRLQPVFPENCRPTRSAERTRRPSSIIEHWRIDCGSKGLASRTVRVEGLADSSIDVLVRASLDDGSTSTTVLHAGRTSTTLGSSASGHGDVRSKGFEGVFKTYLTLGIEHILLGFDHLLFVSGLLLLVGWRRRLIGTITAFTAAHSITLAGASLGLVDVPGDAVEACIAMSILLLAVEVAHAEQQPEAPASLSARYPWALSFAFGLLHGFGFAGALAEIGLPDEAIPAALLSFNLGVEAGQLLVVGGLGAGGALVRSLDSRLDLDLVHLGRLGAVYALGTVAAYWSIARTLRVLGHLL